MHNAQRWGNVNRAPPSPSPGVAGGSSPGRLAENGRSVLNPLHLGTSGYTQSRPWPPTQTQGGGHSNQPFDYYVTRGPNNTHGEFGESAGRYDASSSLAQGDENRHDYNWDDVMS